MNWLTLAQEVFDIEISGMQKVRDLLGEEFNRAIILLTECLKLNGKIIITGVGKNLPIGQKMAATFNSTGAPSIVMHPQEALHGDLGLISKNDIIIALSYSGQSDELTNFINIINKRSFKIIAITGDADSALAKLSTEVICINIDREACPFNMAPTTSTTVALVVGDALAMALLAARGFKKEDFAKLHPAGAIGRALLLKAADIMRKGDRIAKVKEGAQLQDAIIAMTSARAGSAVVIDSDERVLGIFADGDLRRYISLNKNINNVKISEVMTKKPITLKGDNLAIDVLAIYEKHNIDDIIIVDDEERLIGVIDIQDLPKMKIL